MGPGLSSFIQGIKPIEFFSCAGKKAFSNILYWLIDYLWFYVPLKNFHLHGDVTIAVKGCKFRAMLGAQGLWAGSRERSLSCHTCCDTGPRFFRSHPKDRPIQSPLTTHKGMWKIYSNPDPHMDQIYCKLKEHFKCSRNCRNEEIYHCRLCKNTSICTPELYGYCRHVSQWLIFCWKK
jgi:hypothetical protein